MDVPYVRVGSEGIQGLRQSELGTRVGDGGMFARWTADHQTLHAETDSFGMFPLFYAPLPNGIAAAQSPIQLIAIGAEPGLDLEALAVFHLLGYFIGDDTPFRSIKALNGSLEWREGALTLRKSEPPQAEPPASLDEAIERYAALFSEAIADCVKVAAHPILIPLSGGRDSRHIALELHRQGVAFEAVSYNSTAPGGFDPDAQVGAEVAAALGVHHRELTGTSRYRDQIAMHRLTHLLADEHFQMMPLIRHLANGAFAIFDGLAGDSLSRNGSFTDLDMSALIRSGKLREAVDRFVAKRDGMDGSTFHDRTAAMPELRAFERKARERIAVALEEQMHTPEPYAHFTFRNRTRREIALISGIMLPARQAFVPYLAPQLASLCLSLPQELTQDGKFHDHVMNRSFPDFSVPYAKATDMRWRRQRPLEKARIAAEALIESRRFGLKGVLGEPSRLMRAARGEKAGSLYVWSAYRAALDAVSSPAKARRFLAG